MTHQKAKNMAMPEPTTEMEASESPPSDNSTSSDTPTPRPQVQEYLHSETAYLCVFGPNKKEINAFPPSKPPYAFPSNDPAGISLLKGEDILFHRGHTCYTRLLEHAQGKSDHLTFTFEHGALDQDGEAAGWIETGYRLGVSLDEPYIVLATKREPLTEEEFGNLLGREDVGLFFGSRRDEYWFVEWGRVFEGVGEIKN